MNMHTIICCDQLINLLIGFKLANKLGFYFVILNRGYLCRFVSTSTNSSESVTSKENPIGVFIAGCVNPTNWVSMVPVLC